MILEQAWNALNDAHYEKAIELCEEYFASGDKALSIEAHKIAGLSFFKLKNYEKATWHYHQVAEFTNDSDDWFNVTTAATLAGEEVLSFEAFEKSLANYEETSTAGTFSVPNMRLYFMKALLDVANYEKAFEQLAELKKLYCYWGLTEDVFLYMRGIPSLEETLKIATPIFKKLERGRITQWLDDFEKGLDEDGQIIIRKYREAQGF